MRLLASVNTLMNGQGRTLDELFAAIGVVADVRSDSSVNTFYVTVRILYCKESESHEQWETNHDGPDHCVEQNPFHMCCMGTP